MRILIIYLLLTGCSAQKTSSEFETVSMNSGVDTELKISENQTETYGPDNQNANEEIKALTEKEPVISLSVYSSLYSSLALVDLFKRLEKEQLNISMIDANGFAAVVAALYAKEKSSNALEWKLFSLLKKIEGIKPYSKEWKEVVESFLEDEFKNMRLEQLKIFLKIPFLSNEKMILLKTGKITEVLLKNLDLNDNENYFKRPAIYKRDLMESASDLNFNIVFLPKDIKFKLIDGYSWGIFTNYLGFIMKHSDEITKIETDRSLYLDELLPLSEINSAYSEGIKTTVEQFQAELKTWKEEITASSN